MRAAQRWPGSDTVLFHAVAQAGGFAEAGRRLGMRRQSVSERMTRLEDDLGVRLVERTTRTVRLTEAGFELARHCAVVVEQLELAETAVQGLQSEPSGRLRVSAPVLYGRWHLAPLLAKLLAKHPELYSLGSAMPGQCCWGPRSPRWKRSHWLERSGSAPCRC